MPTNKEREKLDYAREAWAFNVMLECAGRAEERIEVVMGGDVLDLRDLERVLEDARTSASERSGEWQPIESAPKDKAILLASQAVWNAGDGPKWSITVGYWDDEFEFDNDEYRGAWTDDTVASWGYQERTELMPSHWRMLPAHPEALQPSNGVSNA